MRIVKEYKEEFLYLKYTLLKNLRLPYDVNFFRQYDDALELTQEDIQNIIQEEKKYYEDKSMKYNETEINGFMEKLNIQFETFGLLFENIDISKYNIPYYFESEDILAIIALMFKEFMSDNHNTIRQCQNCGYYFVPSNLKEDKLLDKYRKRYMSLASSVSHYGTNTAIARFEKYKKDGSIMKQKYLNKEITPKDFEKWINNTK